VSRDTQYDQLIREQDAEWRKAWCVCGHHEDIHVYGRECQNCLCDNFRQRTPNPIPPPLSKT